MGGYGSGRRGYGSKDTTSAYLRLDVRWLNRKGYLFPGKIANLTWSRNGAPIGNISLEVATDCVFLRYRHRRFEDDP